MDFVDESLKLVCKF